jgi:uridine phosphorylase
MMAETLEDVENWSKEGFLGVEMEAATIFAVSKHFNVPAAALLVVGDNLIKGETVASESYKNNKEAKEEIRTEQYKVALSELLI